MSVSLYWSPAQNGNYVGKRGLIDVLEKAFGRFPETLSEQDISTLEVAARFAGDEIAKEVRDLILAVEIHKLITLSQEY